MSLYVNCKPFLSLPPDLSSLLMKFHKSALSGPVQCQTRVFP